MEASGNIQVYAICIDAFPEISELKQLLKDFQRVSFVCAGAFTTATMTSMISGTVGSEIIPGGIGYNTSYSPKFLEWRKKGTCLVDLLINSGKDVIVHNHIPWMSHNIVGTPLSEKDKLSNYRDHEVEKSDIEIYEFGVRKLVKPNLIYSSTNPDLTLNTFLDWGSSESKEQFYSNEKKYFNHIKNGFNGLLWTDLCHWHEAVYYASGNPYSKNKLPIDQSIALIDSIEWLKSFDFNQPNSVFLIYADHSHRVESYLDPPGYITWAYWKDNRIDTNLNGTVPIFKNLKLRPVISSYDIYTLILSIFNLKHPDADCGINILSELPLLPYNPKRIYYTEDGRSNATDKTIATNFTQTKISNDHWISVSKHLNGLTGHYLKISPINNHHSYEMFYRSFDNGSIIKTIISCPDGISPRTKTTISDLDSSHLLSDEILAVAKELGW